MSRRLILGILVVLIVSVLVGTVVLVVQRLKGSQTSQMSENENMVPQLSVADQGNQKLAEEDPDGDLDGDGLSNADELLWGTDPTNPDTDGDGYTDGEEVATNHNPTVAGPNDVLPSNFQPGQDLRPLDTAPLQVDQYFEEGLNLYTPKTNMTEEFAKGRDPGETTTASMITYARSQPVITKLPTVQETAIKTTTDNAPLTLKFYLNQANLITEISNAQTLSAALNDMYSNNSTAKISAMALQIRQFQQSLFNEKAPTTAMSLHKLLLGYTELLAVTLDEMALWNTDPIRSMVALQQLDKIDRQYYPLITQEIRRLAEQSGS
jgi:hypothetical protein